MGATNCLEPLGISLYARSMRFKWLISGISLLVMMNALGLSAAAQPHNLTPAEVRLCQSINHCIDIVDRHDPSEFDYQALQTEFLRYGPNGTATLIRMVAGNNKEHIARAQNILAKNDQSYRPQDQAKIASLWPRGDLRAHSQIMQANLSPLMLSIAIKTLSHTQGDVRRFSRNVIDEAAKEKKIWTLSQIDLDRLSKAAIAAPTPAMIALLKAAPVKIKQATFIRVLRSGNAPSVIAAYEGLYADDPKIAFESLLGTLGDLKDTEGEATLAIAALLRHRHKSRTDGFYLNFAADIANDPNMSAMGRLAGFDAVMGSPATPIKLPNTPIMIGNLKTALKLHNELPTAYAKNLSAISKGNPDPWLISLWDKLKLDPYKTPETAHIFMEHVGLFKTQAAKSIVTDALSDKRDFTMVILGLKAVVRQKDRNRVPQIKSLMTHSISDVRAASAEAIEALTSGQTSLSPERLTHKASVLNRAAKTCRATPKDFKAEINQLPYFDLKSDAITSKAPLRGFVQTIAPTLHGWLVGFAAGDAGGDLQYYDNKSGSAQPILNANERKAEKTHSHVRAILPITPQPLGQYTSEFWAFITQDSFENQAAIYRVSHQGNTFNLQRQAQLPAYPLQISQQANADIFIGFETLAGKNQAAHPPLILTPKGELRRACEKPRDTDLKALP